MTTDYADGRVSDAELKRWQKSPPIHPAYLAQLPDEKVSYAEPPREIDRIAKALDDT